MRKTINLPLLNLVTLNEATQEILEQQELYKRLEFVRSAIINLATEQGFRLPSRQPVYMPPEKWRRVQEAKNKHRSVDYSYVVAFYWLKSLPGFSYKQKSEIIREAIIAQGDA